MSSGRSPFRDSITLFMLVTCGFSWGIWLPTIASQRGWIAATIPTTPWGSFGPAIGALVVLAINGRLAELRERFRFRRVSSRNWLIALFVPMAATLLSVVPTFLVSKPDLANLDKLSLAPLVFLLILVLGGPMGEEPGWRGYVLPKLLARYSPLGASLLLSLVWTTWHLPLFWMEGAAQEGSSIPLFFAAVVGSSIIFTWLYQETNGSLAAAVVLHASINFSSYGLGLVMPSLETDRLSSIVQVVIIVAFALAIVWSWRRRKEPVDA